MNKFLGTAREFKGRSLIDFPDEFCVVDLETSGLDPEYDYIIEVGAIKYLHEKEIDSFQSLVNAGFKIPRFITELTGITNDMIKDAPEMNEVLPAFHDFLGDNIIIGHNVNFDINFLYDSYVSYLGFPLKNDFVDLLRIARMLYTELPHHRLRDLVKHLNIEVENLHRALGDCEASINCYKKFKKAAIEKYGTLENFRKYFNKTTRASYIQGDTAKNNPYSPLYKKYCVFTGKLEKMLRRDAMKTVADLGGINQDRVTRDTNFLILGNNDYCISIKDGKSNKLKTAESYKLEGQDIEIIPENVFYEMIVD